MEVCMKILISGIILLLLVTINFISCSTSIHVAAKNNDMETVNLLLKEGTNVDEEGDYGRTSLMEAASMGHLDMVKLLLDSGANVNDGNWNRYTPLHTAAYRGHLDVVKLLLDSGANINEGDEDGYTPLYYATKMGHLNVVKLLLEYGADPNVIVIPISIVARYEAETALGRALYLSRHGDDAYKKEYVKIAKILKEYGAVSMEPKKLKSVHEIEIGVTTRIDIVFSFGTPNSEKREKPLGSGNGYVTYLGTDGKLFIEYKNHIVSDYRFEKN
jgi:hypothetical protein